MSSRARESRINDALSQLLHCIVPTPSDEDEVSADARHERLFTNARTTLNREGPSNVVADVSHVSDLITSKLVRDNDGPEKALSFGNLYSRLLSQPVLSQKWAILYLLHSLADTETPSSTNPQRQSQPAQQQRYYGSNAGSNLPIDPLSSFNSRSKTPATRSVGASSNQPHRTEEVFDDAFARDGLPTLPSPISHRNRQSLTSTAIPPRPRASPVPNGHSDPHPSIYTGLANYYPPESSLLRELPFVLQGVSSTNFNYLNLSTLKLPESLPIPIISLLHSLAEPSLLYKGITHFLDSSDGGLVGQSLRAAIGIETRSYLGLVASLEGQIRRALAMIEESQSPKALGRAGVTLKRCVLWTRDATMGLRLLSLIIEDSKKRKGGQIISLIHSFSSSHGDPFVKEFAERLLTRVTRPLYDMLRLWIYDGELSDPYEEFFVKENYEPNDEDGKGGATSVWEDKYKLDENMIPTIMTEEFARKVFLIGKSLNFIRYGCGDSGWVETYSKDSSRELRYGDTEALDGSIDSAYRTTMSRLTYLMNDKFKLMDHLTALKKYLLLGQGDFVALLMESLSSNLDRPANSQYRHTLTAQLEHAIRNSNAQYESDEVLRRLDARMLELSHGEIGWDVFTLEYRIDTPVDVVVTSYGSKQYLKVFNFLWRVKRVEYALGSTWRRCMTGDRGVLGNVSDILGKDWKLVHCIVAEMIHFATQLQYYILFEVIEASWDQLVKSLEKPDCTLDDMIQAHAKYLRSITRKGLLASSHLDFTSQLHELLKIMLAYRDAIEGLYSYSVTEFSRRQEKSARVESRTAQGRWGITERDEDELFDINIATSKRGKNKTQPRSRDAESPMPPPLIAIGGPSAESNGATDESGVLPALRKRLNNLATDFKNKTSGLLGDLAYQPDMDLRFLGVVMNFNDVYKVVRRSRRTKAASAGEAVGSSGASAAAAAAQRERERERTRDASSSGRVGGVGSAGAQGHHQHGHGTGTRASVGSIKEVVDSSLRARRA